MLAGFDRKQDCNIMKMRKFPWSKRRQSQALEILLRELWGLSSTDITLGRVRPEPYINHYQIVLEVDNLPATRLYGVNDPKKVAEIVITVKAHISSTIATAIDAIKDNDSIWANVLVDEAAATSALELACKLWLFSKPSLDDASCTIIEANKRVFASAPSGTPSLPTVKVLSSDFSAKSLTRKGGFYLVWTSDLSDHLTFAARDQLRVFRHAHSLQRYRHGSERLVNTSFDLVPTVSINTYLMIVRCTLVGFWKRLFVLFTYYSPLKISRPPRACVVSAGSSMLISTPL
jgi:hypothetical protein